MFLFVFSETVLLLFWFTLFVCTFDSDLLSFLLMFVLLLVEVELLVLFVVVLLVTV